MEPGAAIKAGRDYAGNSSVISLRRDGAGNATRRVGKVSALPARLVIQQARMRQPILAARPARDMSRRDKFSVVCSDNSYFALACVSFHRCRRVECSLLRNFTGIA